jgi:raffinose/stachyose/melibiose transport system permease protein
METKKKSKRRIEGKRTVVVKNIISCILVLYTFISIYLIGMTMLNSFKTKSELINNTMGFPKAVTLDNFRQVIVEDEFLRYLLNSVILVVASVFCLCLVSSMLSYALAHYEFKGKALLENYFLLGLMFPIQLGILPLFIMLTKVHLNNTLPGLVLIYTANLSFSTVLFTNFFRGLPKEVLESARIDGAGDYQVFTKIVVPISRPVISTVGLISFVQIWNDFYMPLVFLTRKEVKTLTLGIYSYSANFLANWNKIFAAITIALIPIIIIYFFFSEQIVEGLTGGAVKG